MIAVNIYESDPDAPRMGDIVTVHPAAGKRRPAGKYTVIELPAGVRSGGGDYRRGTYKIRSGMDGSLARVPFNLLMKV